MSYVPPSSLVPLFPGSARVEGLRLGRLTAFNTTSMANTVDINGQTVTDLPVFASAVPELTVPSTVLLIPLGGTFLIASRIRTP